LAGGALTSQERISKILRHQEPDRIAIHDTLWEATIKRWRNEGLPEDVSPDEYFGYEIVFLGPDESARFPARVVEKNDRYIVETTADGGIRKNFRDYSTTPEIIDYPVKTKKDWEEIEKRLAPDYTRVDWISVYRTYQKARDEGKFVVYGAAIGYDRFERFMRSEELLVAMITETEWVKRMFRTVGILVIEMAKIMMDKGLKFDGAFMYNDMGYRNSSLFSPETYRKTHFETDRMIFDFFHSRGMPVILHSDGNVKPLIPSLIDAGLDCLQPLEVKAGMNLCELKREYGKYLSFMGGIDVRLMSDPDPSRLEEEIRRKFEAAKVGGGYIYHSDHSIPKNVSFEQYCHVVETVKRYWSY
jgi:uroporphyrinogen decarboxylase